MYYANRRNFFIRSIAVVASDIALATALASACLWLPWVCFCRLLHGC